MSVNRRAEATNAFLKDFKELKKFKSDMPQVGILPAPNKNELDQMNSILISTTAPELMLLSSMSQWDHSIKSTPSFVSI